MELIKQDKLAWREVCFSLSFSFPFPAHLTRGFHRSKNWLRQPTMSVSSSSVAVGAQRESTDSRRRCIVLRFTGCRSRSSCSRRVAERWCRAMQVRCLVRLSIRFDAHTYLRQLTTLKALEETYDDGHKWKKAEEVLRQILVRSLLAISPSAADMRICRRSNHHRLFTVVGSSSSSLGMEETEKSWKVLTFVSLLLLL
jgi:hypothetical protein